MPKGTYIHAVKYPHIFIDGIENKRCYLCKEYLSVLMFGNNKTNKDGLATECKPCKTKLKQTDEYRAKNLIRSKEFYHTHKEQALKTVNEYRIKNKDEISIKRKARYDIPENKEAHKEKMRLKRLEKDPAFILAKTLGNQRYYARQKSCISTLTAKEFRECLVYFDNKDAYTGLEMTEISHDHIIPLSKGGSYTKSNIIPCEKTINSCKGTKDFDTWYKKQTFFSEQRFQRIKQWMGYKPNSDILQTSFF